MSMGLTPKTLECREFIASHVRKHGFAPTIREIADKLGYRSTSGVHRMLDELVERGHVRRLPRSSRGIELVAQVCHHCGNRFGSAACHRAAKASITYSATPPPLARQ